MKTEQEIRSKLYEIENALADGKLGDEGSILETQAQGEIEMAKWVLEE